MAKNKTFSDKLSKSGKSKKTSIKLIRTFISDKTGSVRFSEDMINVPEGKTIEDYIKEYIQSK